jgi:quercetin dioxygenase-like cupin family protein
MQTRSLTELIRFAEDAARTEVLAETGALWAQLVCLQGAQGVGPMRDEHAEALVIVLAGEVAAQAGKARARMKQWETTTVAPGTELTLRNASDEPGVVLLVLSPPPGRDATPGPEATED